MPFILSGNVGSATAATGYDVANSVRFDDGSNCQMRRAGVAGGNQDKFTLSMWIKRSNISTDHPRLFTSVASGDDRFEVYFENTDELHIEGVDNGTATLNLVTSAKFRDVAAWMHILLAVDTGQGTEANRAKLYINGVLITAFGTSTRPDQNGNIGINTNSFPLQIGERSGYGVDFDGYFAEIVLLDGTQAANTDLGEFDEDSGIWKPIDPSGLTFGTNGFYLDFEASGNLGNDVNGGTDFSEANLAAIDQTTDTCTNNFATLNGLATGLDATLSEGNLKMVSGTATTRSGTASSIGLTAGKWFAEFKITVSANGIVGIAGTTQNRTATDDDDIGNYPGRTQQGYGYLSGGDVYNNSSAVSGSFASFTTNDFIGVAVDLDNDLLYFYKNGAIQNSGTGIDISGITPQSGNWFFAVGDGSGSTASTVECNFGNPITALSSAVADGNGFGAFEFTPKSGHFALCTKNLAEYG